MSSIRDNDVPSLKCHYRGHTGNILAACFHPNLPTLFSSGADAFVWNWNFTKETRALRFEGHCGAVNDVCISKNGDLMISASEDCTARIWVPVINGHFISVRHTGPIRSCAFDPQNENYFVTASNDKTIKLWSVQTALTRSGVTKFRRQDFIHSYKKHNNWVRSVRFSSDGNYLVSSCDDKRVRIFDKRTNACTAELEVSACPLKADFNPCGNTYVGTCTSDGNFLMFDIRQKLCLQRYESLSEGSLNSFQFHPGGDFAVTIGDDAKIKILDLVEGRPVYTLHGPRKSLHAISFNTEGTLLATGGNDEEILIWELKLGKESFALQRTDNSKITETSKTRDLETTNFLENGHDTKNIYATDIRTPNYLAVSSSKSSVSSSSNSMDQNVS